MVVAAVPIATMRFEQVASTVRQHDRDVPVAVERNGPDEALLSQVPEVTGPWVGRTIVMVKQIT